VPRPIIVEVSAVLRYDVLTRFARFALLINPPRLGILER
jgi:hypothetical protein